MPIERDRRSEREARIDMILEELRLNTEDMHELAKQARDRATQMRTDTRLIRESAAERYAKKKP